MWLKVISCVHLWVWLNCELTSKNCECKRSSRKPYTKRTMVCLCAIEWSKGKFAKEWNENTRFLHKCTSVYSVQKIRQIPAERQVHLYEPIKHTMHTHTHTTTRVRARSTHSVPNRGVILYSTTAHTHTHPAPHVCTGLAEHRLVCYFTNKREIECGPSQAADPPRCRDLLRCCFHSLSVFIFVFLFFFLRRTDHLSIIIIIIIVMSGTRRRHFVYAFCAMQSAR